MLSPLPEASVAPFGVQARAMTEPVWPLRTHGGACVVGEAPEADGVVATGGGEGGAVGRAGEGVDGVGVALKDGGACVGGEAPEADGVVNTAGGECGAVRRAGEGPDVAGVSLDDGGACVVGLQG